MAVRDSAHYALAALRARRSARSTRPAGIVLVHHDVAPTGDDPARSLTPALGTAEFRAQLTHIGKRYRIVSRAELAQLVAAPARAGRLPVALTFDDDLSSHHRYVAPILSELGLPATFFLTGRSLEGAASFWWHDLQELFRAGGAPWGDVVAEAGGRWRRVDPSLGDLARTIEMSAPAVRDELATRLRELAGQLPGDAGLSTRAVRDLVAGGFEIGFHTLAHHQLQTLDDAQLQVAMRDGAEPLTELAGHRLEAVAYPFGAADLRVAAAAGAAGFTAGYTVRPAPVVAADDPLLIPRLDAGMPPARLAHQLAALAADAA